MDDKKTAPAATTALAPATRAATMAQAFAGLMPTTLGEAFQLSSYLAKSGVIPKALKTPDAVLAVILAGMEVGLSPLRALNGITIISGNMTMKTDLQLALVRRSGLLQYHDEGFELRGQSDTSIADRARDGAKVLQLVAAVPAGMPYGWCTLQRVGDTEPRTYVFSWVDAERVKTSEWEDGIKSDIKLSEKQTYKNFPQSMYPRRARGAGLQVLFSDVLANIPAQEAMEGGQASIVADVLPAVDDAGGDDVEALLARAGETDPELSTKILAGFEHLAMNRGRQLQMLTQYRDNPEGLYQWLRDEAAKRLGADAAPPKKAGASHPVERPAAPAAQPVQTAPATVAEPPAAVAPDTVAATVMPIRPDYPEKTTQPAAGGLQALAAKFDKKAAAGGGVSF
jgi:hypothetical protein